MTQPLVPTSGVGTLTESSVRWGNDFRPEIEGLRAVAIALIVGSHAFWGGQISGGVDVFLLISGYVVTVTLMQRWIRDGVASGVRFLSRVSARLIPAVATLLVVVSAVAVALVLIGRPLLAADHLKAVGAAALFSENWYLGLFLSGYLAPDRLTNPVLPLWALSVQIQLYLMWLVITKLMARLTSGRRIGASPEGRRRIALGVLAVLVVASAAWSLFETFSNQTIAYLDPLARVWEFAFGGLLALLRGRLRMPAVLAGVLGWLALGCLLYFGPVVDIGPWFPGVGSWPPVIAAIALLLASEAGPVWGVQRALGSRFMVALGGLAFGVFLWHWPVMSWWNVATGRDAWGWLAGIPLVGATVLLAMLSRRFVERPSARFLLAEGASPRRALVAALVVIVVLAGMGLGSARALEVRSETAASAARAAAADSAPSTADELHELLVAEIADDDDPAPLDIEPDRRVGVSDEMAQCVSRPLSDADVCRFGPADAEHVVAVVGDSISASWYPALRAALGDDWRIDLLVRSRCPVAAIELNRPWLWSGPDGVCTDRVKMVIDDIIDHDTDLVIATSSAYSLGRVPGRLDDAELESVWQAGLAENVGKLEANGVDVLIVSPPPGGERRCDADTARVNGSGTTCATGVIDLWRVQNRAEMTVAEQTGARYLNTIGWFCADPDSDQPTCPYSLSLPGTDVETLIRYDPRHITQLMAERLGPVMREGILEQYPEYASAIPSSRAG